ncbi:MULTISPECIES: hypothetical protein [Methylosinus]|uniref:Uncharacterized protein n=1 Tax=Methylosinus trichosporium (strain ATCC 35070 / NCIMB 11131 / UNIQEM 75 / OB3b) TaxID=595536 RepID=A0A2D2CW58_METT3|nr:MULTISPECIES: hypothetical protein [Methylosinus]ATQ66889.1 hypothetical protein CQW49_02495 [Methylosinus trichosporium OB3b]OBS54147.1 hypothetical protein A8B73_02645 [Methylosinus sp. 3S-1]
MIEFLDNDDTRFPAFLWVSIRRRLGIAAAERFDAALETMPVEFRAAVGREATEAYSGRRPAWEFTDQIATLVEDGAAILPGRDAVQFVHGGGSAASDADYWITARTYGAYRQSDDDGRRLHEDLLVVAELFSASGINGNILAFARGRRREKEARR